MMQLNLKPMSETTVVMCSPQKDDRKTEPSSEKKTVCQLLQEGRLEDGWNY